MPAPVTVAIEVPQSREEVYDFLDVMANHESFNDHLMTDWRLEGPERGLGAKAHVKTKALGVTDEVDFEVTEVDRPRRITERNVARKAGRTAEGTYVLEPAAGGVTRVEFTFRWIDAPLADRLMGPVVRGFIRRNNEKAMRRLAAPLDERLPQP